MESVLKIKEKEWEVQPGTDESACRELAAELDVHPAIARILINRGLSSAEECRAFFRCSLDGLGDPFQMKGMGPGIERLEAALAKNEKIAVYGDYDVDGITSIAIIYRVLRALGGDVSYYVPNRLDEGYGLSEKGISEVAGRGVTLMITVDCGITAVEEVARAAERGIDVIVTDHHEPGAAVPDAVAVIDPKQADCGYGFKELAGVGIAFKLLHGLFLKTGEPLENLFRYLDIVALGTIADIVPLTGENRILVRHGLARMERTENTGINALLQLVGLKGKRLTTGQVVFMLAPRLNAGGRMGDAGTSIRLLITDEAGQAHDTAERLEEENRRRKDFDTLTLREADEMLSLDPASQTRSSIVLASDSWHVGVIGIVASRLTEKYYLPTVLISFEEDEIGRGSARSIANFDIYEAFKQCDDLLETYGGHKYAAGLSIRKEMVNEFAERFDRIVTETLGPEDLVPKLSIDATLPLDDISPAFVDTLKKFAPFGPKNSRPVFFSRGTRVVGRAGIVGNNHLKFRVREQGQVFDAIGFDQGKHLPRLQAAPESVDLAYNAEENEWNNMVRIQLRIKDVK